MYTATVLLRRTEAEFWKMTPRKLNVLVKAHIDVNAKQAPAESSSGDGYIDEVF